MSKQKSKYWKKNRWKKFWGVRYLLFLLIFAFFYGCALPTTSHFPVSSQKLLVACKKTLLEQGFLLDNEKKSFLQTQWKVSLSPYPKEGKRELVRLYVQSLSKKKGKEKKSSMTIFVHKELNYTPHDYQNPDLALWVDSGLDERKQEFLSSLIRNKIEIEKEP